MVALLILAGCASAPKPNARVEAPPKAEGSTKAEKPAANVSVRPGGYYQDDGPEANPPPDLEAIPDAEPKAEPLHRFANRPYSALGKNFVPDISGKPYQARGLASWYGKKFHGKRTSSGEIYDMYAMTAAHPTLPIPSYVRVTSIKNGKRVVLRINDRGPFHADRVIDLSYTAAHKLGIVQAGSGLVEVESLDPAQWPPAATSVAAAEKLQPLPAPSVESFWLQLGAFGVLSNAEQLLAKLKTELGALGDSVRIHATEGLYRLRAGPFKSSAEASEVAVQLQRLTNIQPMLLR